MVSTSNHELLSAPSARLGAFRDVTPVGLQRGYSGHGVFVANRDRTVFATAQRFDLIVGSGNIHLQISLETPIVGLEPTEWCRRGDLLMIRLEIVSMVTSLASEVGTPNCSAIRRPGTPTHSSGEPPGLKFAGGAVVSEVVDRHAGRVDGESVEPFAFDDFEVLEVAGPDGEVGDVLPSPIWSGTYSWTQSIVVGLISSPGSPTNASGVPPDPTKGATDFRGSPEN